MQIERVFSGKQTPAEFVKMAAADIRQMSDDYDLNAGEEPYDLPAGAAGLVVRRWTPKQLVYALCDMVVRPAPRGGLDVQLVGEDNKGRQMAELDDGLAAAHVARGGLVSEPGAGPTKQARFWPTKPGNFRRWQRVWRRIEKRRNMTPAELTKWYNGLYGKGRDAEAQSYKTLSKIIRAGEAGNLERFDPP